MPSISRRTALQLLAGLSVSSLPGLVRGNAKQAHIIIVGGGISGCTAAKYLRRFAPEIRVTLIEPQASHRTGSLSNWVIAGLRDIQSITHDYEQLRSQYCVNIIQAEVKAIEPDLQAVCLSDGQLLAYDRLIFAAGTSLQTPQALGYNSKTPEIMPHAWRTGEQIELLQKQLKKMKPGGKVLMFLPRGTISGPQAVYERASLICSYLKQYKPGSKLLVVDPNPIFPLQGEIFSAWRQLYGFQTDNSLIEWIPLEVDDDLLAINNRKRRLYTLFDSFRAHVINLIPQQRANDLAMQTGLTDASCWCPVSPTSFESTLIPKIHVIGDACHAPPLPKTASIANNQAKTCAFALISLLREQPLASPIWLNSSYSLLADDYAISKVSHYRYDERQQSIHTLDYAGGVTNNQAHFALEAGYAEHWYENLIGDTFR